MKSCMDINVIYKILEAKFESVLRKILAGNPETFPKVIFRKMRRRFL